MELHQRNGAFVTSTPDLLVEIGHQIGYIVGGVFFPICDTRKMKRGKGKAKDLIQELLDETPNLREQAKAGYVTFSVFNGTVYCHTTAQGFKVNAPGSVEDMRTIDDWRRVNLTPEEYAEAKKKPVQKLEGAALDAWAQSRVAESEQQIAEHKSSKRRPTQLYARVTQAQPAGARPSL